MRARRSRNGISSIITLSDSYVRCVANSSLSLTFLFTSIASELFKEKKGDGLSSLLHHPENEGSSYYGIQVSGKENLGIHEREAKGNLIRKNDFSELTLRDPDDYSNNHLDGIMFSTTSRKTGMAHVWLNPHSQSNELIVDPNDFVLEEGQFNQIMYDEFLLLKKKQLKHPVKYQ